MQVFTTANKYLLWKMAKDYIKIAVTKSISTAKQELHFEFKGGKYG